MSLNTANYQSLAGDAALLEREGLFEQAKAYWLSAARVANAENRQWAAALRRALVQSKDGQGMRKLADKVVDMGFKGDMAAIRELGDRIDGKAIQEVSGEGGGPLQIVITPVDADL